MRARGLSREGPAGARELCAGISGATPFFDISPASRKDRRPGRRIAHAGAPGARAALMPPPISNRPGAPRLAHPTPRIGPKIPPQTAAKIRALKTGDFQRCAVTLLPCYPQCAQLYTGHSVYSTQHTAPYVYIHINIYFYRIIGNRVTPLWHRCVTGRVTGPHFSPFRPHFGQNGRARRPRGAHPPNRCPDPRDPKIVTHTPQNGPL